MAVSVSKSYKYLLDITSPRPVRYDENGKVVAFYKYDTVLLRFKITNGHCIKDLSNTIARLRVDLPNGKTFYQRTDINIIDPTDGDIELILDKQAQSVDGNDLGSEDYATYMAQLEIVGTDGSILTPHFLYNVLNATEKPDWEIEGATPSVLGKAVLGKTVLGKVQIDAETVRMIEMASEPIEVQSNISSRLMRMVTNENEIKSNINEKLKI